MWATPMSSRLPTPAPPSHSGFAPSEVLLATLLAVVAGVGGLVWIVGQIAGRVVGGGWPPVGLGEMPSVLVRLPQHLSDPARAWPNDAQPLLPGPVLFYAVAVASLALLAAALLAVVRTWHRLAHGGADARDARWATGRDLAQLRVRGATPGRLTLGRVGRSLIAAEERQSVLVVGPTQTGKTSGLAIPAILEWDGPVIATSVKSDLLRETLAARRKRGRVWVYDPTGTTGLATASWTPLEGARTWGSAQRMATWLVDAARPQSPGISNPEFWYATARKLLAPLLLAAAIGDGLTIEDVVRWVDTQEEDEVRWILDDAGQVAAIRAFEATLHREAKSKSGAYTTVETIVAPYADPVVLESARAADLTAAGLLDGGRHTAYLCAPAHEQQRLQPLFASVVMELITAVYERSAPTGAPLDPPMLLVLDECANIAPIRQLATIAATGAGQGIQVVTVFQDSAQINAVYGRDIAPTIVTNHRAKLLLPGIADADTLRYVSTIVGDEPDTQVSTTDGWRGERSSTKSTRYRSLLPPNALRQMRPGEALLVYGTLPPAKLTLRKWFKDRTLRDLAKGSSREAR